MLIGGKTVDTRLFLAPMAGVTDIAFRTLCREHGAGYTCTEMVSSRGLVYEDKKTPLLLKLGDGESPAAAQIFGNDPFIMAKAAEMAIKASGADFLDINMGCPMPKVVNNGDGSALMRRPEMAARIVEEVVSAVDVPVTVKMRAGWDKGSINAVELAKAVEQAGAAAVAVHGRTKTQLYSGRADWDVIREVKKAVSIPVIGNGDAVDAESAAHLLRYTGADAVMIGRGAFGDPWIFEWAAAAIEGREAPMPPTLEERLDTAVRQFEISREYKGEHIACLEARKHYCWYLKGIPYSGYFKEQIVKIESFDDIYRLTEQMKRELR